MFGKGCLLSCEFIAIYREKYFELLKGQAKKKHQCSNKASGHKEILGYFLPFVRQQRFQFE